MRQEVASFGEFLAANHATTCINLLRDFERLESLSRISRLVQVQNRILDQTIDIEEVKQFHLVWYKPNEQGEAGWDKPGSEHYTVGEYAQLVQSFKVQRPDVRELTNSLSQGLHSDVTLLIAYDTSLDRRVVVDGCKRAVALTLLIEQGSLAVLPPVEKHSIALLQLESKWAHVRYPCDFLAFMDKAT